MNDNDSDPLLAALVEIRRLETALRAFGEVYARNADPGTSDLDDDQPQAWHAPLGAWRRAYALTREIK